MNEAVMDLLRKLHLHFPLTGSRNFGNIGGYLIWEINAIKEMANNLKIDDI
jgi:hypothetical protein